MWALLSRRIPTRCIGAARLPLHAARRQQVSCSSAAQTAAAAPAARRQQQHQTLDFTALRACCVELSSSWVPAKVEEVVQPDSQTISLRLRTLDSSAWLHLSWSPTAARVCIGPPPSRAGAASEAFTFVEAVNKALSGKVLLSVDMPAPWERVLELGIGSRPGEEPSHRVYCEVMGKYSNVVLCAADGQVIVCAYQVGSKMSSLRQVQTGRPYTLPPVPNGIPPSADESFESWRANVTGAADLAAARSRSKAEAQPRVLDGCVRAYQGTSPALVDELCRAAGVDAAAHPAQLSDEGWRELHGQWSGWMQRLAAGQFAATLDESTGRFSVLGSYSTPYQSVHEMLSRYYGDLQASQQFGALYQRLSSALGAALKRGRGRVAAFEKQLRGADEAVAVQKVADLLTANIYRIKPGDSQVEVVDWEDGSKVVLPLEPTKSPAQNSEALYKRARKLRRAVDAVEPLVEAAQREVAYLEEVEASVVGLQGGKEVADLRALLEVQEELVEAGVLRPPAEMALATKAASKVKKAAKKAARRSGGEEGGAGFRKFTSPGGLTVLVGRNNRQNDELSLRVAAADDLWMHVRGIAGSHTVLRIPSGQSPSDDDIQCAADLAAFFSKARNENKVEIVLTKARYVRKPKGAKPGQVAITSGERSWMARPSASLAAVEAAKAGSQ